MGLDDKTLTYEKLQNTYNKFKKADEESKLDKDWLCPFAKSFNSQYFVSFNCYQVLLVEFDRMKSKFETKYQELSRGAAINWLFGVTISPDDRVADDDFVIYYEDEDKKLYPVMRYNKEAEIEEEFKDLINSMRFLRR